MLQPTAAPITEYRWVKSLLRTGLLLFSIYLMFFAAPSVAFAKGEFEQEVIRLVNEERRKAGVDPLEESQTLRPAAQQRAVESALRFSHTRPNGSQWRTVFAEFGVDAEYRGENLAAGQRTPSRVVLEWMQSAQHRANILDAQYTQIAVGYEVVNGVPYWSQLFMMESSAEAVAQRFLKEKQLERSIKYVDTWGIQTVPEPKKQLTAPIIQPQLRNDSQFHPVLMIKTGGELRRLYVEANWSLADPSVESWEPVGIALAAA